MRRERMGAGSHQGSTATPPSSSHWQPSKHTAPSPMTSSADTWAGGLSSFRGSAKWPPIQLLSSIRVPCPSHICLTTYKGKQKGWGYLLAPQSPTVTL